MNEHTGSPMWSMRLCSVSHSDLTEITAQSGACPKRGGDALPPARMPTWKVGTQNSLLCSKKAVKVTQDVSF